MSEQQTDRRQFIQASALAGVGFWAAGGVTAADEPKKDRVQIACIGVGGKGSSDADHAANHGDIVAICDIDDNKLNAKAASPRFREARKYNDFRKMFDEIGRNIEAVVVRHARPHARGRQYHGDAPAKTRLLPEAVDARCA